jgi:small nuclear ribonucleoprotein (snRNP)-like protein
MNLALRDPATGVTDATASPDLAPLLPLFEKKLCVTLSDGRRIVGKLQVPSTGDRQVLTGTAEMFRRVQCVDALKNLILESAEQFGKVWWGCDAARADVTV